MAPAVETTGWSSTLSQERFLFCHRKSIFIDIAPIVCSLQFLSGPPEIGTLSTHGLVQDLLAYRPHLSTSDVVQKVVYHLPGFILESQVYAPLSIPGRGGPPFHLGRTSLSFNFLFLLPRDDLLSG